MSRPVVFMVCIIFVATSLFSQIMSPVERNGYSRISSHEETMDYLEKLVSLSPHVSMRIIGKSVEGREIPALFFSSGDIIDLKKSRKTRVLIYAQQHGNEPSGKEAILILSREILSNLYILKKIDLILVPMVNPDGNEHLTRRNANAMDLNRNHVILSEPEARALHSLFLEWMPEVTLDVHEYNAISREWIENGFLKDAWEMMGCVSNINIDKEIIEFSKNVILAQVADEIKEKGIRFHEYVVGSPFNGKRIRFSTTNVNDGRQSMGIYNTMSFILEGKRYGHPENLLKERVERQLVTIKAFLEVVAEHSGEIKKIVSRARESLVKGKINEYVHIKMDYIVDSLCQSIELPVFDLYKWKPVVKEISPFYGKVVPKKSIKRPAYYIVPEQDQKLLEVLKRHRIRYCRLKKGRRLEVEIIRILNVYPDWEEDKPDVGVNVEVITKRIWIRKGAVIIPLTQLAGNLIPLILEPESTFSIVKERSGRKYCFKKYIEPGREYPIYRCYSILPDSYLEVVSQ